MKHTETRDRIVGTLIELFGETEDPTTVELKLEDSIPPDRASDELAGRIMAWAVAMINRELRSYCRGISLSWSRKGFTVRIAGRD